MPDQDAEIRRLMAAGLSDDDIIFYLKDQQAKTPPPPAAPTQTPYETAKAKGIKMAMGDPSRQPSTMQKGALLGGLAAGAATGGLAWPIGAAASVLGGTVGAGAGQVASGQPLDLKEAGKEGLGQGFAEIGGRAAPAALKLLGRGMYRAGLLPINEITQKYGDIVKTGVENRIPVSSSGHEQAIKLKNARLADKWQELAAADDRGVRLPARDIAENAKGKLLEKTMTLAAAGEPVNAEAMMAGANRFANWHAEGVTPTSLEKAKNTIDDRLGGAYRKMREREPLTSREEGRMQLSHAQSRALEDVVPDYRAMNRSIMDAAGLEQAIQRRTVGSGGNQGLENAMFTGAAAMGHPGAIPARIAMLPPVMSSMGIGTYQAGKTLQPGAAAALKALIALLGPSGIPEPIE